MVVDAVRDAAWPTITLPDGQTRRRLTPEGVYGRKKMTACLRRTAIPAADGVRAGDLLNRDFTAPRPDHTWVMDLTYVRSWAGFAYVAFILDVFSQRVVAWHAQTTKQVELVMIPLRMALWERARQGHPIAPAQPPGAQQRGQSIHGCDLHRAACAGRDRTIDRVGW